MTYDGNIRLSSIGKSWSHTFLAYSGDLVISRINCFRGSIGVVPLGDPIGVSQETYVYRPKDALKTNITYIWLLLRHPLLRAELERLCTGAAEERTRLDPLKWLQISIPAPAKHRQDEIVAKYQAIAATIATQKGTLATKLETFNQNILHRLGVRIGKIPTPHSFAVNVSYIDNDTLFRLDESFHRVRTIVLPIIREPKTLVPLTDYVDAREECAHPKDRFTDEFPYIEIGSIDKDYGFIRGAQHIPVNEAPSRARMTLRAGDVVLSSVRPFLGQCAIVGSEWDNAVGTTGFLVLATRKNIDGQFINWLLRSEYCKWKMIMWCSGSTYPALVPTDLDRITVPKLSPREMAQFVAAMRPEWDTIEALRLHLEKVSGEASTFIETELQRGLKV